MIVTLKMFNITFVLLGYIYVVVSGAPFARRQIEVLDVLQVST